MPIMTLRESLDAALDAEPAGARDKATADLARKYADAIDAGGDLSKLGPAMLAALEALQMSPRARALAQRGKSRVQSPGANRIDELSRRRNRQRDPATVDASAP
jgi:hypothetical protein